MLGGGFVNTELRELTEPRVFDYFDYIDNKFSTFKDTSEISEINAGKLPYRQWSADMKTVFQLSEETKLVTNSYFDISRKDRKYDPSGLVKGWAIFNASKIIESYGFCDFYLNVGGDIQANGKNEEGENWKIGIKDPFQTSNIIKRISVSDRGVATSGNYERGEHIYNPKEDHTPARKIASLTVVGPNVYEADRFATAAFVMGSQGIDFIDALEGFEAYMVDQSGNGILTSGFDNYLEPNYASVH